MTASTRFWKRQTAATSARVTLSASCTIDPPRREPITIRLRPDDDGPQRDHHFVINMTAGEADYLARTLAQYVERLTAEPAA